MIITPFLKAMLILAVALAIVAAFGFHWAKQEREEYRAKHRH
jgi:lipopolysaccharide export LptBFGC system permease protein LptF